LIWLELHEYVPQISVQNQKIWWSIDKECGFGGLLLYCDPAVPLAVPLFSRQSWGVWSFACLSVVEVLWWKMVAAVWV
jgi:hypothetical protein